MSSHSLLSPSSAHRWMRCPGSVALSQGIPDTSSKYADEGTAAHQLASWCLDGKKTAASFLGDQVAVLNEDGSKVREIFIVDDEMAENVQCYVDNVLRYAGNHPLLVEQRVDYSKYVGVADQSGTGDAIILDYSIDTIEVHDLKYGRGVKVFAEDNEQEMLYGLGALYEYAALGDWKQVRLVIHQPRLDHLDEHMISVEELLEFAAEAANCAQVAIEILAKDSDLPARKNLTPGTKQCMWCKAKATCPALTKHVHDNVMDQFGDVTAVETIQPNSELGKSMSMIELIEGWCKAVRGAVEVQLLQGNEVPGYKLVQGRRGARKWIDGTIVEKMMKGFRVKAAEMYKRTLISPTVAEKLLKTSPKCWKKLQGQITRSDGAKSVAPESDKRPAINVKDQFKDLT